nr:EOG090X0DBE [Polyphemus pediculus]
MMRLEEVIRERNESYWLLEVGEEAPKGRKVEELDPNDPLAVVRKAAAAVTEVDDEASSKFKYLLKEKERKLKKRIINKQTRDAMGLLKRFPHLDLEALQEKYPDIEVEKLKLQKKTVGHHQYNTA